MRYLDYSFDKPILPQPLETLEILFFVVLTLSGYLNICVGRLGQSIFWNSVDYHFSKEITATCMRYLDYCFNKPTLPSPLETLEILCLVVVTLSWYHNIRKGARGDRFFGSRSITAIFPLKNGDSLSNPFSAWRTLNWDCSTLYWSSDARHQPCIMGFQSYYLFALGHSNDFELSRQIARACLVSIFRWQTPILFRFMALIESIWNGESNEIETSRIHCKVAKIWIFRNSDSKSLWKNSLALPYLIFTPRLSWV